MNQLVRGGGGVALSSEKRFRPRGTIPRAMSKKREASPKKRIQDPGGNSIRVAGGDLLKDCWGKRFSDGRKDRVDGWNETVSCFLVVCGGYEV